MIAVPGGGQDVADLHLVALAHDIDDRPLRPLLDAPWTVERLTRQEITLEVPRLELAEAPLWGATAFVLKAWLDSLAGEIRS